ncbi:MAG: HAMP domain-containing sensor histidine kinase [Lapillicoccus sp.]
MRQRISWLVAATTSAVIVAFVIPLCLLVRTLAEDRAVVATNQVAQNVAVIVTTVTDASQLSSAVGLIGGEGAPLTSVLLASGAVVGATEPSMTADPRVQRARASMTASTDRSDGGVTVVIPVAVPAGLAVIRTSTSPEQAHRGVTGAWLTILGLGLVLFVVALAAARSLGRRIGTPVGDLAAVAHRLRLGELDARATPRGPPEVVELGAALNLLADRIGELLALEREAVADLGHRLRTPVTALRLDADLVGPPDVQRRVNEHIDHLQYTIDSIITEARRPVRQGLRGTCDAVAVTTARVDFWRPLAEEQSRELTTDIVAQVLRVPLSADDVVDLVDNLIENVFAHTPEGTPMRVRLLRTEDGLVHLTIEDGGPGLSDAASGERGASGSGSTGLGLDIVARIAASAGGRMQLETSELGGVAVHVSLRSSSS